MVVYMSIYMQHSCRTGGATKLSCKVALPCAIPLSLQIDVWAPGSCIFFFFTRISMILMIKRFWKTPPLRVARSLLLWVQGQWLCLSSSSAPQRLKDMLITVQRTAAECLSAEQSAPREDDLKQNELGGEISLAWVFFFFFLYCFFEDEIRKRNLAIPWNLRRFRWRKA